MKRSMASALSIARRKLGQHRRVVVFEAIVVVAFGVYFEEAVELHNLTCCRKGIRHRVRFNFGGSFLYFCIGHLRSYCSAANERIEFLLLSSGIGKLGHVYICGANGLVSFLGTLRICMVLAHVQILAPVRTFYLR